MSFARWQQTSAEYVTRSLLMFLTVFLAFTGDGRCADGIPRTDLIAGVRIHYHRKELTIPFVAASDERLGCLAILPPNSAAKKGTLICRLG